jgi:hypothetical protein
MRENVKVTYRLQGAFASLQWNGEYNRGVITLHDDKSRTFDNAADALTALLAMNANHSEDNLVWTLKVDRITVKEGE